MTSFSKVKTIILIMSLFLIFFCSKDEIIPVRIEKELTVMIIAGPENNSTVLNNAHFSFEWRVIGGDGGVEFSYQLQGVDASAVTTYDHSHTYSGLSEGTYTFTISGTDDAGTTSSDSRTFTVGGSLSDPVATIYGPRGSQSLGGSGVTPEYAPGATVNLRWTGSDGDRFGGIAAYRYKTTAAGEFSSWALGTTAGFSVPTTEGTYQFTLEVKDNAGTTTSENFSYKVKTSEILIVDDLTFSSSLAEIQCDDYYERIFDGFAYTVIDIENDGLPASISSTIKVAVWYGESSSTWNDIGASYPEASNQLSDFIDGGGKLWAMGWGILEALRFNGVDDHANPPAAEEFEAAYLHISTSNAWARAGAFSGSNAFSFAVDVLGQPDKFPKVKIGVSETGGDVDAIEAGTGAEIVYTGTDGLANPIGDVALRYPTGGTSTEVFFMTFPFFVSSTNRVSPLTAEILVQEMMREMGQ